jgi:hypothetical protein
MRKKSYCYFHLEVVRRRRLARLARKKQLLAEAKLYDDRILGVNSYAMNILGPYSRATSQPSATCAEVLLASWFGPLRQFNLAHPLGR